MFIYSPFFSLLSSIPSSSFPHPFGRIHLFHQHSQSMLSLSYWFSFTDYSFILLFMFINWTWLPLTLSFWKCISSHYWHRFYHLYVSSTSHGYECISIFALLFPSFCINYCHQHIHLPSPAVECNVRAQPVMSCLFISTFIIFNGILWCFVDLPSFCLILAFSSCHMFARIGITDESTILILETLGWTRISTCLHLSFDRLFRHSMWFSCLLLFCLTLVLFYRSSHVCFWRSLFWEVIHTRMHIDSHVQHKFRIVISTQPLSHL